MPKTDLVTELSQSLDIPAGEAEAMLKEAVTEIERRETGRAMVRAFQELRGARIKDIEVRLNQDERPGVRGLSIFLEDGHYIEFEGGQIAAGWRR